MVSYEKTFANDYHFKAMVGHNLYQEEWKNERNLLGNVKEFQDMQDVLKKEYETAYKNQIEEIAKKIKNRLYKMESHETEVKIMDQDTKLLDDEIERFLYSYE